MRRRARRCPHSVLVRGAGLMRDGLACEACGYAKYPEALPTALRLRIRLGLTKVRDMRPGELFRRDGVR